MKRLSQIATFALILLILTTSNRLHSQVIESWAANYRNPDGGREESNRSRSIAVDREGDVIVAGESRSLLSGTNITLLKYNQEGERRWVANFIGPGGLDVAVKVLTDNLSDVYVLGSSRSADGITSDLATVKFSSDGQMLWVRRFDGTASDNDQAIDMAIDREGNVLVTGWTTISLNRDVDVATIKYSPDGEQAWIALYDGGTNADGISEDIPVALVLDNDGDVFVTGWTRGGPANTNFVTIKYDRRGTQAWEAKYSDPRGYVTAPEDIAADDMGNVYVTGQVKIFDSDRGDFSGRDMLTLKYDFNGREEWAATYGETIGFDFPKTVSIDTNGNVRVVGHSCLVDVDDCDVVTVLYSPVGEQILVTRVEQPGNQFAVDAATGKIGNLYVAAEDHSDFTSAADFLLLKFDDVGDVVWSISYASPDLLWDIPTDLVIDVEGNMYMTGSSSCLCAPPNNRFTTVRYAEVNAVIFRRGDADADSHTTINDPISILNYLFFGGPSPTCLKSADADDSGTVELSDAIRLLNYLFRDGPVPREPFFVCGFEKRINTLDCVAFSACP
jgi:hypothetical protein